MFKFNVCFNWLSFIIVLFIFGKPVTLCNNYYLKSVGYFRASKFQKAKYHPRTV